MSELPTDLAAGPLRAPRIGPVLRRRPTSPARARRLDAAARRLLSAWEALLHGGPADTSPACLGQLSPAALAAPLAEALSRLVLARALHERGRTRAAAAHLSRARRTGRRLGSRLVEYVARLAEAHLALDRGDEAAGLQALRRALRLGRRQGYADVWWWPPVLSRLCVRAIEAGIEVEYARRLLALARRRGCGPAGGGTPPRLHGPRPAAGGAAAPVEAASRRVAVVTLGGFGLLRDGRPVTSPGRLQRRPLELLQALVAFGGREVPAARLTDALWPDADGDAAHGAFEVTLHRLRRILGVDGAVVYHAGRLTLDPDICSVDLWDLERDLGRLEARLARPRTGDTAGSLRRLAAGVVARYRGPFLGEEDEPSWARQVRDRLRDRVVRVLLAVGRHLEAAGEWEEAVAAYERGLAIEPCAEALYQRLMTAYRQLGRHAEAVALYRRCCHALAAHLGIEPGPVTRALGAGPPSRAAS